MSVEIIKLLDKMDDEREININEPMEIIPNSILDFRNQYTNYMLAYASNLY